MNYRMLGKTGLKVSEIGMGSEGFVGKSTELANELIETALENGACEGKLKLAAKAKQMNLDAIHDTVHEMAKDEARHGCAFEGLLKRYFG